MRKGLRQTRLMKRSRRPADTILPRRMEMMRDEYRMGSNAACRGRAANSYR